MRFILTTIFTVLLLQNSNIWAQVSGTVFRDYNENGIRDLTGTITAQDGNTIPTAIDAGIAGVTVSAYNAGGLITSTTSASNGSYTLSGVSGQVRIEFSGLPAGYYSTFNGTSSPTSVQFVTAPATVNFGINRPYEYVEDNPALAVGGFTPLSHTGVNANNLSVLTIPNTAGSTTYLGNTDCVGWGTPCPTGFDLPSPATAAVFSQVGGVFGLGWQAKTKTLFAGSYVKILSDLGPQGTGAIYRIDMSNPSSPVVLTGTPNTPNGPIDLNLIFGANTCGTNPFAPSYPDFNLESERQKVGDAVYNTAFADIDVSEDGTKLYALSFADKKLYVIPIDGSPINASTVQSYTIPVMSGETLSTVRGTAIGQKDGLVYIMTQGHFIIDNAYTFDQNYTVNVSGARYQYLGDYQDIPFAIYTFNPQTNSFNTSPILSFTNYTGPNTGTGTSDEWLEYEGYMVMDIVFDTDGAMIMGGRKLIHDVKGGTLGARLLKACTDGSGNYVLEDNSSCGGNTTAGTDLFYFQVDAADGGIYDAMGGLAQIPGTAYVIETAYDIYRMFTAGVRWLDNTDGTHTKAVESIPDTAPTAAFTGIEFGNKTGVLGDIEILASPAPLEIGNRVWTDTDSDGIQDANEAGIDGVTVQLYEGATLVGSTTTANGGQWFFNNTNVNQNGATEVKPNTAYTVRVLSSAFPSGQTLTTTNSDGSTNGDLRDNDATLVSGNAEIAYTTGEYGENNHTLDMGFRTAIVNCPPMREDNITCNGLPPSGGFTYVLTTTLTGGTWTLVPANPAIFIDQDPADPTYTNAAYGLTGGNTYDFIYNDGICADTMRVSVTMLSDACTAPAMVFDTLSVNMTTTVSDGTTPVATNTGDAASIIGGEVDVKVQDLSGQATFEESFSIYDQYNKMEWINGVGDFSIATITWDGNDNDANTLNATGLGGIDLSTGGNFGFLAQTDIGKLKITLRIYTDASNYSESVFTYDQAGTPHYNIPVEFTSFTVAGGTGADMTNVGAVQLIFEPLNLLTESNGIDLSAECFHTPCVIMPACALSITSAIPTACDPNTNNYSLDVSVSYTNPPTGNITINVGGTDYTFTPNGSGSDTFTINDLSANGTAGIDVSATFVGDAACTYALVDAYNAPASCMSSCSCYQHYKATSTAENTATYSTWQAAIHEVPDYVLDFESYALGVDVSNTPLGPSGFSVTWANLNGGAITTTDDVASSPSIGNVSPMVAATLNTNEGDDSRLTFEVPVDYVGFYILDLDDVTKTSNVTVVFSDNTTCSFSIDHTLDNCQCQEFLGIVAPPTLQISSVTIYPNTGSRYSLDNISYGYNSTCPVQIESTNVSSCSGTDAILDVTVTWDASTPSSETISVATTGATTQTIDLASATSPTTLQFTLNGNGSTGNTVSATLNGACSCTATANYDLPNCAATCTLTVTSATPTACDPATNTYSLDVAVTYTNPPAGDMTINVGGTDYTFTPNGSGSETFTVTGLVSNGTTGIDVSATFVGDATCTHTLVDAYDAPASCGCDNVTDPGIITGEQNFCGTSYDPSPITNVTLPTGAESICSKFCYFLMSKSLTFAVKNCIC
jgi:hypothetical protein